MRQAPSPFPLSPEKAQQEHRTLLRWSGQLRVRRGGDPCFSNNISAATHIQLFQRPHHSGGCSPHLRGPAASLAPNSIIRLKCRTQPLPWCTSTLKTQLNYLLFVLQSSEQATSPPPEAASDHRVNESLCSGLLGLLPFSCFSVSLLREGLYLPCFYFPKPSTQ